MPDPLLEVKSVGCSKAKGQPIFTDANFVVNEGDIIILQGKSGAGCVTFPKSKEKPTITPNIIFIISRKSTLLKCLAHLNVYDGEIAYRGRYEPTNSDD